MNEDAKDPPVIYLTPPQAWDVGSIPHPIADLRAVQALAPFRPSRFVMSTATALVFLAHGLTVDFARAMGCVAVLERQAPCFRFAGLGIIEVDDDVPDGEVLLAAIDEDAARMLAIGCRRQRKAAVALYAKLDGALREPRPRSVTEPQTPAAAAVAVPRLTGQRIIEHVAAAESGRRPGRHLLPIADAFARGIHGANAVGVYVTVASVPPRFGLTTMLTHAMALALLENPKLRIGYATYDDRKAVAVSRDCSVVSASAGVDIIAGRTRRSWDTTAKGGLTAFGVLSALCGSGFDALVIDSPFKNAVEGRDPERQEAVFNWLKDVLLPGMAPGGAVIIAGSRYAGDDLRSRCMDLVAMPRVEDIRSIRVPALVGGESTWPERFSAADLESIKADIGDERFNTIFQGEPST